MSSLEVRVDNGHDFLLFNNLTNLADILESEWETESDFYERQ